MTTEIKMRGDIDAYRLDQEPIDVVKALELESKLGHDFAASEDEDGNFIAFRMANILTIREV